MEKKDIIKGVLKTISKVAGYSVGFGTSLWFSLMAYSFIKHGGIIFYENNPIISATELGLGVFGVGFFLYKIINEVKNPNDGK